LQSLTLYVVKKIKDNLINNAKIKKQYAKLKAREENDTTTPYKSVYDREAADDEDQEPTEPVSEPTLELHPDRVAMIEEASPEPGQKQAFGRPQRRPRPQPFAKESQFAQMKKEEADARQKARDEANKERASKLAERERFRKTMTKARGGPNGKRKLGKESTVLLAKVQRLMGKT
jgi:hypothetical protein